MKSLKDFTIELDVVILGIAISSSIEKLATNMKLSVALLFATNLSMCINFFYAKMHELFCDNGDEKQSVSRLYAHFITLLPLAFMAITIDNLMYFIISNLVLRLSDIAMILYDSGWSIRNAPKYQKQWVAVDSITILYMSLFLINITYIKYVPEINICAAIFAFWVIDALYDYSTMKYNYFEHSDVKLGKKEKAV